MAPVALRSAIKEAAFIQQGGFSEGVSRAEFVGSDDTQVRSPQLDSYTEQRLRR